MSETEPASGPASESEAGIEGAAGRAAFARLFAASPLLMDQLDRYAALLQAWQQRMNLVGAATLDDLWWRHFADSAQLALLIPQGRRWLDFGSGAGFPGMVLAAMDRGPVTIVESIAKKIDFLAEVRNSLALEARVTLVHARIEQWPSLQVDVATARAVAPLPRLLQWSMRHVHRGGQFVFPKGRRWREEVEEARQHFSFDLESAPSLTDGQAGILMLRNVVKAAPGKRSGGTSGKISGKRANSGEKRRCESSR